MTQLGRIAPAFGRFLIVGLSGTLVNLSALWLLVNAGLPQLLAALLATELSIISNFVWNDCWTFKKFQFQPQPYSLLARFARFQVVTSLTAVLTLGLFVFLSQVGGLHYLVAQAIAIGLATILNFMLNSKLTWRWQG